MLLRRFQEPVTEALHFHCHLQSSCLQILCGHCRSKLRNISQYPFSTAIYGLKLDSHVCAAFALFLVRSPHLHCKVLTHLHLYGQLQWSTQLCYQSTLGVPTVLSVLGLATVTEDRVGAHAGAAVAGGTVGVGGLSSGNTGSQSGYSSNTGYSGNTTGNTESSTAAKAKSYLPGTAENQASRGNTGYGNSSGYSSTGNTGSGYNTGSEYNTGSGYSTGNTGNTESSTAAKAKSYIPGTAENQASRGNGSNTGYGSNTSGYNTTGTGSGYNTTGTGSGSGSTYSTTGTAAGSNAPGGLAGQPGASRGGITTGETTNFGHEQAPQSGGAVYNADGVAVSALASGTGLSGSGTGAQHAIGSDRGNTGTTGSGLKSHTPGTEQYRETHGSSGNTGAGSGSGNTGTNGSNTGYGSSSGNTGLGSGNTGSNTGYGSSNTGYGGNSGNNDGKPSAGEKLKKLIPGTPEYKAAHGDHEGRNTGGAPPTPLADLFLHPRVCTACYLCRHPALL